MCQCPAHEDDSASLSVAEGTVKAVVVHCHAGCSFQAVADAAVDLGVPRAALARRRAAQVTLYRYHDAEGAYVFTKRRGADKRFSVGVEKDGPSARGTGRRGADRRGAIGAARRSPRSAAAR